MTITDERLMAFADDELDGEAARQVAAAVASDPELAHKVEQFRISRRRLAAALTAAAPAPSQGLLDAAQANVAASAARSRAAPAAIAAAAAGLTVGLASAYAFLGQRSPDISGDMAARGTLAAGLERVASGASVTTGGATVRPIYTVIAADGVACRTFRLTRGAAAQEGLACREGEVWRVRVIAAAPAHGGDFVQAASDEPPAVAAAADALHPGAPLSRVAEQRLIASAWRAGARP